MAIESALKKLDVPARQVVIEMTIAEVLRTDELKFGVYGCSVVRGRYGRLRAG